MTRGQCLCGAVTFTVEPPYAWMAHCHCSMCRKHHGSLFSTSVGVARSRFRLLDDGGCLQPYAATAAFERPFCARCGSKVPGAYRVSHARAERLRWVRGRDAVATYRMSGAGAYRNAFCRSCGSLVPAVNDAASFVRVPVGSLDGDGQLALDGHVYVASKATWYEIADSQPRFDGTAPVEVMARYGDGA